MKGDKLWVLLQSGKATGIEIWESPYCLGQFLDKDKPFYIRFSPEDESLYCDVSNTSTLTKAKRIAQIYYREVKYGMSTPIEQNRSN